MPNWQVSVSSCSRYLTTGLLRRDCQSPVGVNRVGLTAPRRIPVYAGEQTFSGQAGVSKVPDSDTCTAANYMHEPQ
jgi:hypothetical protein